MNLYEWMPRLLNMSTTAGVAILFVMAARLALRGAPRRYTYWLWAVPLFRLLCPVSLSAPFSLLSMLSTPVVDHRLEYIPPTIVHDAAPKVSLPVQAASDAVNAALPQGTEQLAADPLEFYASFGALLWLIGALFLAGWGIFALLRLHKRLAGAVRLDGNVWQADVETAFVWGVLRPRIYLPFGLSEDEQRLVLLHERAHIRRGDHLSRLLAYAALCLHWFNPLVWAAFVLSGRDMETACDETVLEHAQEDIRADYAAALLRAAGGRSALGAPLAFGAGDVGARIRAVLRFRGGCTRLAAVACMAAAALGVCLLVNPVGTEASAASQTFYRPGSFTYVAPHEEVELADGFAVTIDKSNTLYLIHYGADRVTAWDDAGKLEELSFTDAELREAFAGDADNPAQWDCTDADEFIGGIARAWQCRSEETIEGGYRDAEKGVSETVESAICTVSTLFEQEDGTLYLAFSYLAPETHGAKLPHIMYMVQLLPQEPESLRDVSGYCYAVETIDYSFPYTSFSFTPETAPHFAVTGGGRLYQSMGSGWTLLGDLAEVKLGDTFLERFVDDPPEVSGWRDGVSAQKLMRENAHAWRARCRDENDNVLEFYFLEQKDGTRCLTWGYADEQPWVRWVMRLQPVSDTTQNIHRDLEIEDAVALRMGAVPERLHRCWYVSDEYFYLVGFYDEDSKLCGVAQFRKEDGVWRAYDVALWTNCMGDKEYRLYGPNRISVPTGAGGIGSRARETEMDIVFVRPYRAAELRYQYAGEDEVRRELDETPQFFPIWEPPSGSYEFGLYAADGHKLCSTSCNAEEEPK